MLIATLISLGVVFAYILSLCLDRKAVRRLVESGMFLHSRGQHDLALEIFVEVVKMQPDNIIAEHYLSNSIDTNVANSQKIETYIEIGRQLPKSPSVHYRLGCALANLSRFNEAITQWQIVLGIDDSEWAYQAKDQMSKYT